MIMSKYLFIVKENRAIPNFWTLFRRPNILIMHSEKALEGSLYIKSLLSLKGMEDEGGYIGLMTNTKKKDFVLKKTCHT